MPLRRIKNPRSFDKCRACSHQYITHTDFKHYPSKCQYVIDGHCRCQEFVPPGNLEFLEYEYNRRKSL